MRDRGANRSKGAQGVRVAARRPLSGTHHWGQSKLKGSGRPQPAAGGWRSTRASVTAGGRGASESAGSKGRSADAVKISAAEVSGGCGTGKGGGGCDGGAIGGLQHDGPPVTKLPPSSGMHVTGASRSGRDPSPAGPTAPSDTGQTTPRRRRAGGRRAQKVRRRRIPGRSAARRPARRGPAAEAAPW